ncbi:DeoR/GlpR family DNA-binding transcription regulator [Jannaschia sp. 2305UL9-9]|uniref:DeoR/GlpR family DNA-binding transcription regulator n=1 Tax=Jannaschia sp. 2305UL9-9 TaxID=3121638 RepID=UPI003527F14A
MGLTIRKPEIIAIARREGKVTVEGLVEYFGVTPQTIRRDLTELAESGELERVHGGAILPSTTVNIAYNERRILNQPSKVDIARACARMIPNDCAIFLSIGTTTEAIATELLTHEGLLVVTNNVNIASILSGNKSVDVVVTGGQLRRMDGGLIGEIARHTIQQFRFDYAIIGCSALRQNGDLMDFDMQEVSVSKAILHQSEQVLLAADSSKFDRKAPVFVASMESVTKFITDRQVPEDCSAQCELSGTEIVYANTD